jgi:glycosyltransferase involved in cell wall biosynthesis
MKAMPTKILWITHDPIRTSVNDGASSSGFWKEALLELLQDNPNLQITTCFPGPSCKKINTRFYTFRYQAGKTYDSLPSDSIRDLKQILQEVQPQLIHIHGTEVPYGLITEHTNIPVVISLQGFLAEWYNGVLGNIALPVWKQATTLKERIRQNGFLHMHAQWYYNAACEIKTVQQNRYFIGRTSFDHDFVKKHNQQAHYFTGNELLRDAFYRQEWNPDATEPYTIYTSSATNPVKGFHVLLEAMHYLKQEFPEVKLRVPGTIASRQLNAITGSSYYRLVDRLIRNFHLQNHIEFCGKLNAEEIVSILQKTHVFAMPSFMENSSNALGEAQVMGVPSVVTECGGTGTLIKNNYNGLFFRTGDGFDLAQKIKEVFLNRERALQLSQGAKERGRAFHDQHTIAAQYPTIYQQILAYESTL